LAPRRRPTGRHEQLKPPSNHGCLARRLSADGILHCFENFNVRQIVARATRILAIPTLHFWTHKK
jgi:hypothetical protein